MPAPERPHTTLAHDASATPARLPYSEPRLIEYGPLRTVTRTVGMTSNLDGGMGMTRRSLP